MEVGWSSKYGMAPQISSRHPPVKPGMWGSVWVWNPLKACRLRTISHVIFLRCYNDGWTICDVSLLDAAMISYIHHCDVFFAVPFNVKCRSKSLACVSDQSGCIRPSNGSFLRSVRLTVAKLRTSRDEEKPRNGGPTLVLDKKQCPNFRDLFSQPPTK